MAVVPIPVTRVTNLQAAALTFTDASADGNTVQNDGKGVLLIQNGSASPVDVTISAARTGISRPGLGTFAVADIEVTVAAGALYPVAIPPATHNNGNGIAEIAVSDETDVGYAYVLPDV